MYYDDQNHVKVFCSSSAGRDSGQLGLVLLFLGRYWGSGSECGDTCPHFALSLKKPRAGPYRSQRTALSNKARTSVAALFDCSPDAVQGSRFGNHLACARASEVVGASRPTAPATAWQCLHTNMLVLYVMSAFTRRSVAGQGPINRQQPLRLTDASLRPSMAQSCYLWNEKSSLGTASLMDLAVALGWACS